MTNFFLFWPESGQTLSLQFVVIVGIFLFFHALLYLGGWDLFDFKETVIVVGTCLLKSFIESDVVVGAFMTHKKRVVGSICLLTFLMIFSLQQTFTVAFVVASYKIWIAIMTSEIVDHVTKYF